MNIIWNPPETAPLDKLILADVGWPWPLPCIWDGGSESWATAALHCEARLGDRVMSNVLFETHYEAKNQLKAWADFPILPNAQVSQPTKTL
jgi:hypothetical protein